MKNRDIDYVDVPEKKEYQYKDVPKKNESQYKAVSSGSSTYHRAAEPAGHTEMRKIAHGTGQSTRRSEETARKSVKKNTPSAGKILLCMILLVVTGISYVWMWRLWVEHGPREWLMTAAVFVYGIAGIGLILATGWTFNDVLEIIIEIGAMILLGIGLGVVMTRQLIQQGDFTILTFINEAGGGFMVSIMPLIIMIMFAIG